MELKDWKYYGFKKIDMLKKHKLPILLFIFLIVVFALLNIFIPKERTEAISSRSQTETRDIAPIKIPSFYSQQDPKWALDRLGNSNETIGKVGCLISSVCMNLSYYKQDITPKELNQKLQKIDGYTNRGWLIWSKLEDITDKKLSIEFPKLSHKSIDNYLLEQKPVLAKVYIAKVIPHWVLIVGKREHEYLMLDPLGKGELSKVSNYGGYIYSIRVLAE